MKKILLSIFAIAFTFTKAQIAGPNTSTNLFNSGSGAAWTISSNISVSTPSMGISQQLMGTTYNFSVPITATITGITLTTPGYTSNFSNGYNDTIVVLLKNLTPTPIPHGKPGYMFAGAGLVYGTSTDLWGSTWTPADINNAQFGFLYKVQNMMPNPNMFFFAGSNFSITVYYGTATGIEQQTKSVDLISAYANNNQIVIRNHNDLDLNLSTITLTNLLGQKIYSQKLNSDKQSQEIKINVPESNKGLYILSIDKENLHYTKKLYID